MNKPLLGVVPLNKKAIQITKEAFNKIDETGTLKRKLNILKEEIKILKEEMDVERENLLKESGVLEKSKSLTGVRGEIDTKKWVMKIYDMEDKDEEKVKSKIVVPKPNDKDDINLPDIFKNSQAFNHLK